jgi:hypothetical protein
MEDSRPGCRSGRGGGVARARPPYWERRYSIGSGGIALPYPHESRTRAVAYRATAHPEPVGNQRSQYGRRWALRTGRADLLSAPGHIAAVPAWGRLKAVACCTTAYPEPVGNQRSQYGRRSVVLAMASFSRKPVENRRGNGIHRACLQNRLPVGILAITCRILTSQA